MNDSSLKVFVCDPQPASVFGIEHALGDAGITIVGTAGDPSSCLAQADTKDRWFTSLTSFWLMLSMPGLSGDSWKQTALGEW